MTENPRIFSLEYYQRLFSVEESHWWCLGMREIAGRILDHADWEKPYGARRILDAGCGAGLTLSWLARYGAPERIIGVDVSWHALAFCRQRRRHFLSQASITKLPFKSNSFDLVLCSDVLQHLPPEADQDALAEIYRVLRPGKFLYLRTNARGLFSRRVHHATEHDYRKYDMSELAKKLSLTGFQIEKATYANCLLSLVADVRDLWRPAPGGHQGKYSGLSIRVPASPWLNRGLLFVLKCEARYLARWALTLPFGHSLICVGRKPGQSD